MRPIPENNFKSHITFNNEKVSLNTDDRIVSIL